MADPGVTTKTQVSLKELLQRIQKDKQILDLIRGEGRTQGIFFFGRTGSGKTTSLCFLAGDTIVVLTRKSQTSKGYEIVRSSLDAEVPNESFKIGHTADSTTKSLITRPLPGTEWILTDTCGFHDTKGTTVDIANAISLRNAMHLCSSVRPVILINASTVEADKGASFLDLLNLILRFFTPIQNYLPSMTFLFTHGAKITVSEMMNSLGNLSEAKDIERDELAIVEHLLNYLAQYGERCFIHSEDLVSEDAPRKRNDLLDFIQQPPPLAGDLIIKLGCPISNEAQQILKSKCDEIYVSIRNLLEQCEYRQILDHLDNLQLLECSVQLHVITAVWTTCLELTVSHLDKLVQSIDKNYEEENYEKVGVYLNRCRASLCLERFKDLSEDYSHRVIILNERVAHLTRIILNRPKYNQNTQEITDTLKRLKLIQSSLRSILIQDSNSPQGYEFVVSHLERHFSTINTRCENFLSLLNRMISLPVCLENEIATENNELLLLSEHDINMSPTDCQREAHPLSLPMSVLFDDLTELKSGTDFQGHLTLTYFDSRLAQLCALLRTADTLLMGNPDTLCESQDLSATPKKSRELFRIHDLVQICYHFGAEAYVDDSLRDLPSRFVQKMLRLSMATLNRIDSSLLHSDYTSLKAPILVLTDLELNDPDFMTFKSETLFPKIKTVKDHVKMLYETCSANLEAIRKTKSIETSEYISTRKSLLSLRDSCCLDFLYSQPDDDCQIAPSAYFSELLSLVSLDWTERMSNFMSINKTGDFPTLKQTFSQLEIMYHLTPFLENMKEDVDQIVSSIDRITKEIEQVGRNLTEPCLLNEMHYLLPLIRCQIYIGFLSECCCCSSLLSEFLTQCGDFRERLSKWNETTVSMIKISVDGAKENCMKALDTKNGSQLKINLDNLKSLCCFDDFIDPTCTALYTDTRSILKGELENLFFTAKSSIAIGYIGNIQAFLDSSSSYGTHFEDINFHSHLKDLSYQRDTVLLSIPEEIEKWLGSKKFQRIKKKLEMIQESSPQTFEECDLLLQDYFGELSETIITPHKLKKKVDVETILKNLKVIQAAQVLSDVTSFDLGGLSSSVCSFVESSFTKLQTSFMSSMKVYNFSAASEVWDQLSQFGVFDEYLLKPENFPTYTLRLENLEMNHLQNLKPTLEEACRLILNDFFAARSYTANYDNHFIFDSDNLRLLFDSVSPGIVVTPEFVNFSKISGSLSVIVLQRIHCQYCQIQTFLNGNDLDMADNSLRVCRQILQRCKSHLPAHSLDILQSALKDSEDILTTLRNDGRVKIIFKAKNINDIQDQFELWKQEQFVTYREAYAKFLRIYEEKSKMINKLIDDSEQDFTMIDRIALRTLIDFGEALSSFKVKIVPENDHDTRDSCDTLMRKLGEFFLKFCQYWNSAISHCADLTIPQTLMSLLSQMPGIFENAVELFQLIKSVQQEITGVIDRLTLCYQEVEKYDFFTSRETDGLKSQLDFLKKQRDMKPRSYTHDHRNHEGNFSQALLVLRSSISKATPRLKTYLEKEDFATAAFAVTNLSALGEFSDLSEDCLDVLNRLREEINNFTQYIVSSAKERFHSDDDDDGKELARLVVVASSIDNAFKYCVKGRKSAMDDIISLFQVEMNCLVTASTCAGISLEDHSHNILAIANLVSEIGNYSLRSLAKESTDRYLNRLKDLNMDLSKLSEILSKDPAGKKVISDHAQFIEVQVKAFNEETAAIHIDHALAELKQLNEISESQLLLLKKVHDDYSTSYVSFLERYLAGYSRDTTQCVHSIDELVVEIESISSGSRGESISSGSMVELLAGIFALWTIMKASELFHKSGEKIYLIRPHAVQLIGIFRLLGLDQEISLFSSLMQLVTGVSSRKMSGHLIQVGTGEGKSILLAGLSCVLALLGYEVCCACYSEHLSERDANMFRPLFERLNISSRIKYSTLGNLVEQVIQGRELRTQVRDVLVPVPSTSSTKKKLNKSKYKTSTKILPRILLIDEVDVFFSPDFLGVTYNPVSKISSREIESIFRYIWKTRHNHPSPLLAEIKTLPDYCHLVSQFIPEASLLIDHHIQKMLNDVNNYTQSRYEVVEIEDGTWKIGYKNLDSVDCDIVEGYRTAFAYLHESSKRPEVPLRDELSFLVPCGSFSYAEIPCSDGESPFVCTIGVTGTLNSLLDIEKRIVNDKYGVRHYTFTPSMHGHSKLRHLLVEDVIMVIELNRYYQTIFNEILDEREKGRPVLVYFESEEKLEEFRLSSYGSQLSDVNIITEKTLDINFCVEKATRAKMVTFLSRSFGRGLDFKCQDVAVDTAGGVHVIQAFFSEFLSEEIQIKGRTARQSKKGSYKLIMLGSDLEKKLKMTTEELTESSQTSKFYDTLHAKRIQLLTDSMRNQIAQAESLKELHQRSYQFMRELRSGDYSSADLVKKIMSFEG